MAPLWPPAAPLLLLLMARSVGAPQSDACLASAPTLVDFCLSYLYVSDILSPDPICCYEVTNVTSEFGAGCLCEVVLDQQAHPVPGIIPGRMYSLAVECSNSNADMSKCAALVPPGAALAPAHSVPSTPFSTPASWSPPPPNLSPPPNRSPPSPNWRPSPTNRRPPPPNFGSTTTPTFDFSSPPARRMRVSKYAVAGGSVGGVSVFGFITVLVVRCLRRTESACCCQPRQEPQLSHGVTGHHMGPSPASPYQTPYPVYYGAHI